MEIVSLRPTKINRELGKEIPAQIQKNTLIPNLKTGRRAAVENVNMNKFHSCRTSRKKGEKKRKFFRKFQIVFRVAVLSSFQLCGKGPKWNQFVILTAVAVFFVLKDIKMDSGRRTKLMLTNFNDSLPQRQWRSKLWHSITHNERESIFMLKRRLWSSQKREKICCRYGNWLHLRDKYSELCYKLNQSPSRCVVYVVARKHAWVWRQSR